MHSLDAICLQRSFKIQIEIRGVDANKQVWALQQQTRLELAPYSHDLKIATQHLPAIAVHRQFLMWPPSSEAASGHLRPANSGCLQVGPADPQAIEHQTSQQVARGFTSDHG